MAFYKASSSNFTIKSGVMFFDTESDHVLTEGEMRTITGDYPWTYGGEAGWGHQTGMNYASLCADSFDSHNLYNAPLLTLYNVFFSEWDIGSVFEDGVFLNGMQYVSIADKLNFTVNFPDGRSIHCDVNNHRLQYRINGNVKFSIRTDEVFSNGFNTLPWYNPKYSATYLTRYHINANGYRNKNYDRLIYESPIPQTTGIYYYDANGNSITSSDNVKRSLFEEWFDIDETMPPDDDNPYFDGGTSDEGGGGGNFSDDSDDIILDGLPTYDAVGTGFATLFSPTKGQLKALADVMWDSNIFTALQNLVENITDMFTSLSIVPFAVDTGQTVEVSWLGLPLTSIYLTLATKQFYEFDMGSINMADDSRIYTSGSALDYSPFSKLGIFLPFIGFQELDIDECRDATIGLKYRIDILSGTCVALISINGNIIYQFSGNCLSQIPITNENMQSLVSDAVNVGIAATASHAASGAASAEMSAAGNNNIESVGDLDKSNKAMAHAKAHLATSRSHLASATANAAMGLKPTFGKAGSISASASLLSVKQPYLFLTTPRQSIPNHYQRYCGFPSNISGKLNTFSGFTVVEDIRLNGLVATSPEVAEIYQLLKSGIII